jgi:hypothetical protein
MMNIKKGELLFAKAYIDEHFDRIIDWAIGDIRRCCKMNSDGTCDDKGALVGAFILWTCAIDYFGGLYTGRTSPGDTRARFKGFIEKYMPRYDAEKVEDLRWSLQHYYSPHHFVLYHENNLEDNKLLHLTQTPKGIMLHLGWAVKDLEDGVSKYYEDLKGSDILKVKVWRYYKEQLPIMPVKVETLINPTILSSLATGTAIQSIDASGTVSPDDWFKK